MAVSLDPPAKPPRGAPLPRANPSPPRLPYLLAVVLTVTAIWLRMTLGFKPGDPPMMIVFLIPIILSAFAGGLGPGLTATAVAALGSDYYLLPPIHTFRINGVNYVQWVSLIVVGTLVSGVTESLRRSHGQLMLSLDERARLREKEVLLYATDSRLAQIVEGMNEACFALDQEWRFTFVNDRCESLLHHRREEMIGKSIWEVFSKLTGTPMEQNYRRVMQERVPVSFEVFSPIALCWLDIRLFPSGEGLAAFLLDISIRKQAEEALRASEELLSFCLKQSHTGGWNLDLVDRVALRTLEHDRLFGYDALLPQWTYEMFLEHVLPEDRTEVNESFSQAIAAQCNWSFECRIRRADGKVRWIWGSGGHQHDAGGQARHMAGIVQDITDRKQAEEEVRELNVDLEQRVAERTAQLATTNTDLARSQAELQSLFESLPGLYLILDPDLTIVSASDAYLKATMTARPGILGRGLFEVFPDNPDDPVATGELNLRASLDFVLRHAAPHTMAIQKYDVRRPDGVFEERYWSPINSPVLGLDRQVQYIVHRVEDVTDFVRKKSFPDGDSTELQTRMNQMEAEIFLSSQKVQEASRQLEIVNKELESFSYSVSHDLRAPLRAVDGFSQVVIEDYSALLPEEGRRYLQTIRQSAQNMGTLIDDLLAFSRLSRAGLKQQPVDTHLLVQECLNELQPDCAGREIDFRLGELPACVGDRSLLKQVWINLLSNACKYSRKRHPAIIEIGCTTATTGHTWFIRDNGTGFDMRYAHNLFGVFQRLHRAEDYEGTGVGLAIVQRIVERHGGRIWAEAAVDRGATFYFTLQKESQS